MLQLDKLFTEECLVSEDCQNADYCDLNTNTCKPACGMNGKLSCQGFGTLGTGMEREFEKQEINDKWERNEEPKRSEERKRSEE